MSQGTRVIGVVVLAVCFCVAWMAQADEPKMPGAWQADFVAKFFQGPDVALEAALQAWPDSRSELAVVADWLAQDGVLYNPAGLNEAIASILDEIGPAADSLRKRHDALRDGGIVRDDPQWVELYLDACRQRRVHD